MSADEEDPPTQSDIESEQWQVNCEKESGDGPAPKDKA